MSAAGPRDDGDAGTAEPAALSGGTQVELSTPAAHYVLPEKWKFTRVRALNLLGTEGLLGSTMFPCRLNWRRVQVFSAG